MRTSRGSSSAAAVREATSLRLARLVEDLGHDEGPAVPGATVPPVVPEPGRHAARRRRTLPPGLASVAGAGLGPAQLTVVTLVVAVGVGLTAWWVVGDRTRPVATAPVASSAEPLVAASPPSAPPGGPAAESTAAGTVTVDVTGKVRRPGIVVLDAGARVVDALAAAGGERGGVDLSSLNLARVLVDGEQIVVGAARPPPPPPPSGGAVASVPADPVNLNLATPAELETLPDVGPVTAAAIVAWRDEHGGFTSVDELLEVDGIGDVTLQKLAPFVTV